jgi:putative SOS response-associated peptidase YedK
VKRPEFPWLSLADFKGFSTINAQAESLIGKAVWRIPFQRRRCLVPADGFYKWKKLDAKTKQPYAFSLTTDEPFAFAGLWDGWKDSEGTGCRAIALLLPNQTNSWRPSTNACQSSSNLPTTHAG